MKFSEVVSLYISHKRSLGHRFRTEEHLFKSFCKIVGDVPFATIEEQAVLSFLNGNGQVTEYWLKKYHLLSGLYRFALGRGFAKVSPLPRTIPKLTVPAFVPYMMPSQIMR